MIKYDNVISFGCSWVYGDELNDPALIDQVSNIEYENLNTPYRNRNTFAGQLAKRYSATHLNYGINGGSNISSQWEYLRWLDSTYNPNEKNLVIVGLTQPDRITWYDHANKYDGYKQSICIAGGFDKGQPSATQWNETHRNHVLLSQHAKLTKLQWQQTVELFNGSCKSHSIDIVMVNIWKLNDSVTNIPDTLVLPNIAMFDIIHHPYLQPRFHPNEAGHTSIANMLDPEIRRLYQTV